MSRMGTSLRGSPPSAASTQETVAGASLRQSNSRGPDVDGVVNIRDRYPPAVVSQLLAGSGCQVDGEKALRKHLEWQQVRIGMMAFVDQDVASVG